MGKALNVPAGSFRCERFVRSSLASSMAGFISGGRFASLPVWMAKMVVSTDLVCAVHRQPQCPSRLPVREHTSPFSSLKTSFTLSPAICFSVTSEATQPSVVSGCHARVPMS